MHPKLLLIVTACVETLTGLCLLSLPAVVFDVILALDHPRVDTILVGRLVGAALFAIGVASLMRPAATRPVRGSTAISVRRRLPPARRSVRRVLHRRYDF